MNISFLNEPWPWCAAFVCWVVREAIRATGGRYTFQRPTTAGAWDLENWSLAQDDSTQTRKPPAGDIQPGDILCYTFSHTGVAISEPDAQGYVQTVEGKSLVFVKRGDGFERRLIELGHSAGELVEVRAGLKEGDEVATQGAFLLKSEMLR